MAFPLSRRALRSIAFCILFALVAGDALKQAGDTVQQVGDAVVQQVKESSVHAFDTIKDKISISSDEIQTLLHLASQKELDSKKSRSFTTTLFNIIFPSSKPAINALLATAYISGPPNFLLALCPPNIDPSSLSVMVAFAVGGLLGDTFFHLLPEIFLGEDDSETKIRVVLLEPNRNLLLGVFIFIGLATFMAMDKALRIATGAAHSHSHNGDESGTNDPNKKHKHEHFEKLKIKTKSVLDQKDYRLMDDLQQIASQESPEEQQQRLYDKPYNDTMIGNRKTRDVIADIASTNEGIRRRATMKSDSEGQEQEQATATLNKNLNKHKPSAHSATTMPAENEKSQGSSTSPDAETENRSDSDSPTDPPANSLTSALPSTNPPKDLNPSVKLAGLLNLIADFTHNITDGLALSTSFYSSPALGATTTMAVFFHEIPHEVGDFALLIQSGFTKRNAMAAQFVTAIGAFLGTIIGILVQEYGAGDNQKISVTGRKEGLWGTSLQWADTLLPFTAGTFLYVGTVGVIPELLDNEKGKTRGQELVRALMQFGAMAFGALIMVAISWG